MLNFDPFAFLPQGLLSNNFAHGHDRDTKLNKIYQNLGDHQYYFTNNKLWKAMLCWFFFKNAENNQFFSPKYAEKWLK